MSEQLCRACGANPPATEGICSPCHRDRLAAAREKNVAAEQARIAASRIGRRIAIPRGWKLKDGKLVPSTKHLPVNLQLQRQAKAKVRVTRRTAPR